MPLAEILVSDTGKKKLLKGVKTEENSYWRCTADVEIS